MIVMRNNQQWKRLLALVLCLVQCMVLLIPAARAQENAPDAISASSLACDAPIRVTMQEESTLWFGNASQATVKLGEPITNISDRESIILDSPVEEGYAEKGDGTTNDGQTSSFFLVDMNWAKIDVDTQDVMFYIELPAESTAIRVTSVCVSSWMYPARSGMTYQYLESNGTGWVQGTLDGNGQIGLTQGFKGYVRLLVNTASNYETFKDTTSVQSFGFRIDKFGGSFGPAKLGGMWIVSKGEYYEVSVDGGEMVPLTSADPLPVPDENDEPVWTGAVLTAKHQLHSNNVNMQNNPSGQVTVTLADGITKLGEKNSYVVDSPVAEGYANPAGTTDAFINLLGSWISIDISTQDFVFYIELPAASKELRVHGITATADKYYWPSVVGMQYQYLSTDSTEWMNGVISTDGNKTMALPQGFKGFIRLNMATLNNYSSLPTSLSIYAVQFRVDRFGGDDGAVKLASGWVVSREDTRYISIGGGNTICMTDAAEPSWIQAAATLNESAAAGEAAVSTTWSKPSWGAEPEVTMTVGDCINPLGDGQKSIIFDSEQQEGYFVSPATYAHISLKTNEPDVNMAKQQPMVYLELPEASSSFRVDSFVFYTGSNKLSVYSPTGVEYSYLSVDGSEWIDGGTADTNFQFNVPAGFKGYVRFNVTTSQNWWWQNNDGNEAWKNSTAKFTSMTIFFDKYGADLGQAKVGGLWIVNKADFIDASVNGGEAKAMTTYIPEPFVPQAASASLEYAQHLWTAKVIPSGGANKLLDASYVDICNASALRINSNEVNGYANGGNGAATIKVDTDLAQNQDVLIYVELPGNSQGFRVQNTEVVSYKYVGKEHEGWATGTVGENSQIDLPAGFKGYVRLTVNTDHVDDLTILPDAFGGDLGYVLLGGIWLASGGDYAYVSVDGAAPVMIYFEWFDLEKQPSDYSIVIIPDQQVMTYYYPEKLTNMYEWIADQIEPENVQMVLNLGDMTETNSNSDWTRAKAAYDIIAGKVPFMFVPGNHDYEGGGANQSSSRDSANMNTYFPLSMFREMETYGGAYSEDKGIADDSSNTWQTFEVNGNKYLLVALEFGPRDSVLAWAGDVIAAHPDHQTIILTHGYLDGDASHLTGSGAPSSYKFTHSETDPCNDGDGVWDKLVSKHENIVMVLSGHIGVDNVVTNTRIGDNGNEVKEFLIDGQWLDRDLDGVGLVAMMNFSNNGQTVEFTYYCTDKGKYMNTVNQFTFTLPAQENRVTADVEQWNMVLQDDIAANFYVSVSESIRDTAEITVTFNGKTVAYPVADLTAGEDGTYCVTTNVAAAQMNDDITVQVANGDDTVMEKTYTVCQYINTIINDPNMEEYHEVARELLNYGGAAQAYFNYNAENLVNDGLTGVGANAVPETAETEMAITGAAEGISFYGASLVFENKIAVRFYFTGSSEGIEDAVTVGDKFYVEKADILPQNLDEAVKAEVAGLTVSYSPMNYMVRMNVKGSDNLKVLLRALYNYHLAAEQIALN